MFCTAERQPSGGSLPLWESGAWSQGVISEWGCDSAQVAASMGSQGPVFSGGSQALPHPLQGPPGRSNSLCQLWFPRAGSGFPAVHRGPWGLAPPGLLLWRELLTGALGPRLCTDFSICVQGRGGLSHGWRTRVSEGMAGPTREGHVGSSLLLPHLCCRVLSKLS